MNKDNWLSDEPLGQWYGVTADGNGRVTNLVLRDNRLSGELPEGLGNLANLQVLRFGAASFTCGSGGCQPKSPSANRLAGEIPPELGNLANLKSLNLTANQLTGEIPPELGSLSKLIQLWLRDNQLTGEIPPELGSLTNLKDLTLSGNRLTGEIPPELGSLSKLIQLRLYGNQLTGCIPQDLGGIPQNDYSALRLPFCDMPGAPTIATLISAGETSLTVTWTVPINTGTSDITAYDLRYIDNGAADKSDANWTVLEDVWTTGSGSLQYTLTGLTDGTQYDVEVRAVNSGGDGTWSATGTTAGSGDPWLTGMTPTVTT